MNREKDTAALTEAGGMTAQEIYPVYASSRTITLPDSRVEVVMRKPMLEDSINSLNDPLVNHKNYAESTLSLLSQICLFDGKPIHWQDLKKGAQKLSLVDYNFLAEEYGDMQEPGKPQVPASS